MRKATWPFDESRCTSTILGVIDPSLRCESVSPHQHDDPEWHVADGVTGNIEWRAQWRINNVFPEPESG